MVISRSDARQALSAAYIARAIGQGRVQSLGEAANGPRCRISVHVNDDWGAIASHYPVAP